MIIATNLRIVKTYNYLLVHVWALSSGWVALLWDKNCVGCFQPQNHQLWNFLCEKLKLSDKKRPIQLEFLLISKCVRDNVWNKHHKSLSSNQKLNTIFLIWAVPTSCTKCHQSYLSFSSFSSGCKSVIAIISNVRHANFIIKKFLNCGFSKKLTLNWLSLLNVKQCLFQPRNLALIASELSATISSLGVPRWVTNSLPLSVNSTKNSFSDSEIENTICQCNGGPQRMILVQIHLVSSLEREIKRFVIILIWHAFINITW